MKSMAKVLSIIHNGFKDHYSKEFKGVKFESKFSLTTDLNAIRNFGDPILKYGIDLQLHMIELTHIISFAQDHGLTFTITAEVLERTILTWFIDFEEVEFKMLSKSKTGVNLSTYPRLN
jgi:hypothetical protein